MLMIQKPRIPGLVHLVWPFIRRFAESVFAADRMAVEIEQRVYDEQGGDWNQEINPVIVSLRALLVRRGVVLARNADGPVPPGDGSKPDASVPRSGGRDGAAPPYGLFSATAIASR
jgi:renierapurpurin 18,18'-hydroxylase